MAAQRIVLTSPWKLGLFVFLLVAGTGFGLLYAYLEVFGGQFELVADQPQLLDQTLQVQGQLTVREAYIVVGAIALLSLIGYVAVVSSARPLDRVVRGGRKREQALKKLRGLDDPRGVDLEDFEDEPAIVHLLERWTIDADRANEAALQAGAQREAIASLAAKLRSAPAGSTLEPDVQVPDVIALADAINDFAREIEQQAEARAQHHQPAVNAGMDASQRSKIEAAVRTLAEAENELGSFVDSVASQAVAIAQNAQHLAGIERASGEVAPAGSALLSARRASERLGQLRQTLEELAEQANKLAITMALQLNRLGDAGNEMIDTVEEVRTLSTRYQRVVTDLRVCELDQVSTMESLQHSGPASGAIDAVTSSALQQEAMVLDQNAEALREVLGRLSAPIRQLQREIGHEVVSRPHAPVASVASPVAPAAPVSAPEPVSASYDRHASVGPDTADDERVYEIAELGGHAIEDDEEKGIYDLEEFGAVEL